MYAYGANLSQGQQLGNYALMQAQAAAARQRAQQQTIAQNATVLGAAKGGTLGGYDTAMAGAPMLQYEEYAQPFYRGSGANVEGANFRPEYDAYANAYGAAAGAQQGVGGTGGTGTGGSQWDKYFNDAKSANQSRLDALNRGYDELHDSTLGHLEGYGNQAMADIRDRYDRSAASGQQDLVNRGLSSSTMNATMRRGLEREKSADIRRLGEDIARMKVGYSSDAQKGKLRMLEDVEDVYPNAQLLAEMMMRAANAPMNGAATGFGYNTYVPQYA